MSVSLAAKWLKSENTSSLKSRQLGRLTRLALGMTEVKYRKTLSRLRKEINIVETKMSKKQWSEIEYSKLPSKAGMKYRAAFSRNDNERYGEYIESVSKGSSKINAKTLYPYEIVRDVFHGKTDATLDGLWNNLPDYIGNSEENSIAVVDTSGSMKSSSISNVAPLHVAISLGLYLAERAKGVYANHFITFSANPTLQEVVGRTISHKIRNMSNADWEMNTNIERVFSLILNTAIKHRIPQTEMLDKLYIISDMQFDTATRRNADEFLFEGIREKFERAGYKMPKLVFWNVNAKPEQHPEVNRAGVQLVSGCSPSIFKHLLKDSFPTPYELMMDVVNQERYSAIAV